MTEPTQAAKQRACDLANAEAGCLVWGLDDVEEGGATLAFARYIQQVSDVAKDVIDTLHMGAGGDRISAAAKLQSLILPDDEPTANDVLETSLEKHGGLVNFASNVISDLDAAGYEIKRKD